MSATEQHAVKSNPVLTPKRGLSKDEINELPNGTTFVLKDPDNIRRKFRRFKNTQSKYIKPKNWALGQLSEHFLSVLKHRFNEKLAVR